MADYYPLISRAVAALEKNSGENRRAIYERARAALLAQLRGVTPPLSESDITRERLALEESIRKVEAESARQFVEASRQTLAPRIRSAEFRQREELPKARPAVPGPAETRQWRDVEPAAQPPRRPVIPPSPPSPPESPSASVAETARRPWQPSSPPASPDARRSDAALDQPPPEPPQPPRRPAGERRSLFDIVRRDTRNVVAEPSETESAAARAEEPAREPHAPAPALAPDLDRAQRSHDRLQFDRSETGMFDPQAPEEHTLEPPHGLQRHEDFPEPTVEPPFPVEDAQSAPSWEGRPPPPPIDDQVEFERSDEDARPRASYRELTKGLAIAGIIICIGGLLLWQWPNMVALYRSFRAPAVETARDTPAAPPSARPKITDRIEPESQQAPAAPAPAPGAQPASPAAQKVVLYEEDPADPNGKRFVGSAIWRTETVTPAPGQPPELAIRADVEVPERKLAMTWSLRRNTDKGLPATHTVEIMFKVPADFPAGGILNVPGILMKQAEQTRGVPLAGLAVKVTAGFYLIGLSNIEADKERNLQLLKERGWFDIPVVYNNNRRAILAMEKGAPGERAFADAFKAWKQ
jgi:hypothetical protein